MIIRELQLQAFGKFHNKTVSLMPGMNIIEGRNEAGKSTIHAFIRAVLFGIDKEKDEKRYSKYSPWLDMGAYKGAILFEEGEITCYLERDLKKNKVRLTINNGESVFTQDEAEARLAVLLGGLTDTGYANTVSIDQMKGTTDDTIAEELKNNLENLSRARSMSLSFCDAENTLKSMRSELEYSLSKLSAAEENDSPWTEDDEREMDEAFDECSECYRQLIRAESEKQRIFEEYEKKRNEFLDQKEKIEKEQDEVNGQLTGLKGLDRAGRKLTEKKKTRIEKLKAKGKDPVKAFRPRLGFLKAFTAMCIAGTAACTIFYSFFDSLTWLLIIAASLAGAAFVSVIVWFVIESGYKRKRGYYRAVLDRMNRAEEYARREKELKEEKNSLLINMTEEHGGNYMLAGQKAEEAAAAYNVSSDKTKKLTDRRDMAKRTAFIKKENEERAGEIKARLNAVDLAWEHMYKAGEISVKSFGADLLVKTGQIISIITEKKYSGLVKDNYGNLFLTEEKTGDRVAVGAVSRGTMEQIYLALRIAASALLSPKVSLPFILDDTFAYYDDERMKNALLFLKSCGHQVILLTCHSRENRMLKEMK